MTHNLVRSLVGVALICATSMAFAAPRVRHAQPAKPGYEQSAPGLQSTTPESGRSVDPNEDYYKSLNLETGHGDSHG